MAFAIRAGEKADQPARDGLLIFLRPAAARYNRAMSDSGGAIFDPDLPWVARARAYTQMHLMLGAAATLFSFTVLVAMAFAAGPLIDRIAAALPGRWPALIAFAAVLGAVQVLSALPLSFLAGFVVEHDFGLSNETMAGWLLRQLKGLIVGGIIGAVMLVGFFALYWHVGRLWWLPTFAGAIALAVVLARVFPTWILPLFYPTAPLRDDQLECRLRDLAEGTGLQITGVYRLALSRSTSKANAMLAGVGRSRRVLLGDTLLDEMDSDQVAVVFAHELGHHVRGHIRSGLLLSAATTALAVVVTWLVMEPARNDSLSAIARLPLLGITLSVMSLVLALPLNAVSRHFERQADHYALERTRDPESMVGVMMQLARQNLSDPAPPAWQERLLRSHPSIARRIEAARRWRKASGPS